VDNPAVLPAEDVRTQKSHFFSHYTDYTITELCIVGQLINKYVIITDAQSLPVTPNVILCVAKDLICRKRQNDGKDSSLAFRMTPHRRTTVLYKNEMPAALVSDIQKYTIHDGPGIRTAVFFKGCNMRCLWCSNPETIDPKPRLGVYPSKCLSIQKCGYCLKTCPISTGAPICHDENVVLNAIDMIPECENCYKCAEVCPSRAIKLWGELFTVDELMKIIKEDQGFYDRSGGGVTLTGGEVIVQREFAELLLKACKEAGINTCVETALHCPAEYLDAIYRNTDLVITDIKHMDIHKHRKFTGVGNELILKNIIRTIELSKKLVIRTPVVMGYNDDDENIRATGAFIRDKLGCNVLQYQLLPYRKLGTEKYDSLNQAYPMGDYAPPDRELWERNLLRLADILVTEFDIPAVAGSGKKFE